MQVGGVCVVGGAGGGDGTAGGYRGHHPATHRGRHVCASHDGCQLAKLTAGQQLAKLNRMKKLSPRPNHVRPLTVYFFLLPSIKDFGLMIAVS